MQYFFIILFFYKISIVYLQPDTPFIIHTKSMTYKTFLAAAFILFSLYFSADFFPDSKVSKPAKFAIHSNVSLDSKIENIYNNLDSNKFSLPKLESFTEGLKGFYLLKEKGLIEKNILTIVDFSLSSNTKRLWVIDLETNTILCNSLVAHGKNTGQEFANNFSNAVNSYKSSLGFYVTGETYNGKHGMSLRLDGIEKGVNDHARERGVVIHAADYVSDSFIKQNKRLGRSLGCPAIPTQLLQEVVSTIKDKSCLFIYHPSRSFEKITPLIS